MWEIQVHHTPMNIIQIYNAVFKMVCAQLLKNAEDQMTHDTAPIMLADLMCQ